MTKKRQSLPLDFWIALWIALLSVSIFAAICVDAYSRGDLTFGG